MNAPDPPPARRRFGAEACRSIQAAFEQGASMSCPECGTTLDVSPVARPAAVSYVRERTWASCPGCHRSVVLDRRQGP